MKKATWQNLKLALFLGLLSAALWQLFGPTDPATVKGWVRSWLGW